MKKLFGILACFAIVLGLAACGSSDASGNSNKKEMTKLVVGASPTPHAEILEKAKPILKKKGIDLEIKEFQDYVTPNKSLKTGDLDANYFQHKPYLEGQKKEFGYDFVSEGAVHLEPIAAYSKKYDDIDDLPEGAQVLIPSSTADHGRVLKMLEEKGLIKLKDGTGYNGTFDDIAENPKNLKFKHDIDPSLMTKAYQNNEGDLDFINTNYAIDAGLNPTDDSLILESKDSPYANLVVVRKEDADKPAIKTLVDVLQSKEIQQFIVDKWHGQILPVKLDENKS